MKERKYTLNEIDRMRLAVSHLWYFSILGFRPKLEHNDIEDRLRTYMINGTIPEELEQAAAEQEKIWVEYRRNNPDIP